MLEHHVQGQIPLKGIHTDEHCFRGTTPRVDLVLLVSFSNVVGYHRFVDVFQHDDIVLVTLELELRYRPFSLSSSGNPSFRLVVLKMIDIGIRSFRILCVWVLVFESKEFLARILQTYRLELVGFDPRESICGLVVEIGHSIQCSAFLPLSYCSGSTMSFCWCWMSVHLFVWIC